MDFYADVLDHTGKTPRELGAIHLHAELVTRAPSGQALAVLWLQSAFEPLPPSDHLLLVTGRHPGRPEPVMIGQFPLPRLEGGRVVRWRLPLSLPEEVEELHFQVSGTPHPKAERVRPAWKLLDVIELPKESEMKAAASSPQFSVNLTRSVVASVLTGGPAIAFRVGLGSSGGAQGQDIRLKRHAAAPAPTAFIAAVIRGEVPALSEPQLETVWTPGMPLPEASLTPSWERPPSPPTAAAPKATRVCKSCYFEGPSAEYARATMCPACDAAWY